MALKKKVIQDDGVTTEYHRILYVSKELLAQKGPRTGLTRSSDGTK